MWPVNISAVKQHVKSYKEIMKLSHTYNITVDESMIDNFILY